MPSVVHVVVTDRLAGVERYVCTTAAELAGRGWETTVVGGDPELMPAALGPRVRWLPGATPFRALASLGRLGRQDVCHAHMTLADGVAAAARPRHRAAIVSTRHFAAQRGSRTLSRALAPLISASIDREIAVSSFVAGRMERRPDSILPGGVPAFAAVWQPSSRAVLVLQRLEPEKDTLTALRAWEASRLWEEGWSLRVVGEGSERPMLEEWTSAHRLEAVTFTGWVADPAGELAGAGVLLAPGPRDSLGLSVLEAMAAGVPVLACASGGHLETVGLLAEPLMFGAGDVEAAARLLRSCTSDEVRERSSTAGRELVRTRFSVAAHVDRLVGEYEEAIHASPRRKRGRRLDPQPDAVGRSRSSAAGAGTLRELVVCSLEAWDEVWRRNQFFTDLLLRRNPELRVLFVEPAADPLFELSQRRAPSVPGLRSIRSDGRLVAFRPLKALPRRLGPQTDVLLRAQVRLAARLRGFERPTLWLNDVTYAPLIAATGWPTLYDVTDDWLLAPAAPRERERLRRLEEVALECADEVVVCSPALRESRGAGRPVRLIRNGVDVDHFRRPRPRPDDVPAAPVAVYVGTLHENRLDVPLLAEVASSAPDVTFVLVGPDSLTALSRAALGASPNIRVLGARDYQSVPAYLQHADVIIVPHVVSEFTESLDPIKAYECLAVSTPVVATPVAGFREHGDAMHIVSRDRFSACLREVLERRSREDRSEEPPSWDAQVGRFEVALHRAISVAA